MAMLSIQASPCDRLDMCDRPDMRDRGVRYDFVGSLQAAWRAFRQHRRDRAALIALSRHSPRLLRDMGLDPARVYTALDPAWEEDQPDIYLLRGPRDRNRH